MALSLLGTEDKGTVGPSLAGTQQHSVFISPKTKMSGEAGEWQDCLQRGNVA
jgi:hypothetical protein